MELKRQITHCKNCGAPAISELCSYCKKPTEIQKTLGLEYPTIECKEVHMNIKHVESQRLFSILLGALSILILIIALKEKYVGLGIFSTVLGIISSKIYINAIKKIKKYVLIKQKGKEIEAVVKGFINDTDCVTGYKIVIVKLLLETNEGKKYILYELDDPSNNYKINDKIKLRVYKDMFHIVDCRRESIDLY